MDEMMKLVVGWTLVGGFVFTVAITCLSLVGWVRFADPKQQRVLFGAVVVELLVAVGGVTLDAWKLDFRSVDEELQRQGGNRALAGALEDFLAEPANESSAPSRDQLLRLVDRMQVRPDTPEARRQQELRTTIERLPAGTLDAAALREVRSAELPRLLRER